MDRSHPRGLGVQQALTLSPAPSRSPSSNSGWSGIWQPAEVHNYTLWRNRSPRIIPGKPAGGHCKRII
eukprot:7946475-Heterocapsa_arctica.AAC.1